MTKRLNIKNAEAHAIALELAREAGTSITQVVVEALRARLLELSDKANAEVTFAPSGQSK